MRARMAATAIAIAILLLTSACADTHGRRRHRHDREERRRHERRHRHGDDHHRRAARSGTPTVTLFQDEIVADPATGIALVRGTTSHECRTVELFGQTARARDYAFEVRIEVPPGRHVSPVVPRDAKGREGPTPMLAIVRDEPAPPRTEDP